jgi:hypothetical protein
MAEACLRNVWDVQAGNDSREDFEVKAEEMRALGADPEIYDKLTKSVAPSIWQLDDVKKGILCQLFGGCSKVRSLSTSCLLACYVFLWCHAVMNRPSHFHTLAAFMPGGYCGSA